jgi:hypothetical protein
MIYVKIQYPSFGYKRRPWLRTYSLAESGRQMPKLPKML